MPWFLFAQAWKRGWPMREAGPVLEQYSFLPYILSCLTRRVIPIGQNSQGANENDKDYKDWRFLLPIPAAFVYYFSKYLSSWINHG